MAIGVKFDKRL